MSVSFSPWALLFLPLIFILLLKWPRHHVEIIEDSRVGFFRRIAAFYVDMFVGMIGVLPFISMPPLFLEYLITGEWQWSFERSKFLWVDYIGFFVIFIGFYGIYYYAKWHFKNQKQTLGQHFLGFKLVAYEERHSFAIRAIVAHITLSWWPFWPWTLFGKKQDYIWDTASKIKARRVKIL